MYLRVLSLASTPFPFPAHRATFGGLYGMAHTDAILWAGIVTEKHQCVQIIKHSFVRFVHTCSDLCSLWNGDVLRQWVRADARLGFSVSYFNFALC